MIQVLQGEKNKWKSFSRPNPVIFFTPIHEWIMEIYRKSDRIYLLVDITNLIYTVYHDKIVFFYIHSIDKNYLHNYN